VNAADDLAKAIIENYDNQLKSSTIDVPAHVESLLQTLGATSSDSGGKVTYYGSDPITPDRLPYGSISAAEPPRGEFYQDLLRRATRKALNCNRIGHRTKLMNGSR